MWDPGKTDGRETNSCKINDHLQSLIGCALIGNTTGAEEDEENATHNKNNSRTELDSHANMPVVASVHSYYQTLDELLTSRRTRLTTTRCKYG
jgi:hypothetical protein